MAILIVSDSHRLRDELSMIVQRHQAEVSTFIHCGDSELKMDDPVLAPFQVVRGNCDYFGKFPKVLEIEADGLKLLVTHGHYYDVKYSFSEIITHARLQKCQVACFGHSHQAVAQIEDGVLLINPGSIRQPRGPFEKSYVILEKKATGLKVTFYELSGAVLKSVLF